MKLILKNTKNSPKIELSGQSFGAPRGVSGELVFNTGMAGYVETLTDPSYKGQILVMSYPLQGNYGVPSGNWEAPQIQVQGLVVLKHAESPSHHSSQRTLGQWLMSEGVPGLSAVDTRLLTQFIRESGSQEGILEPTPEEAAKLDPVFKALPSKVDMDKVLDLVAPLKTYKYGSGGTRILLVDTGSKENIVRCLVKRGATVIRAPWSEDWEKYIPEVDGIFLANGPGDPAKAQSLIARIRALLALDKPIFGICLGHQLLALAAGAKTSKMKFGHRSLNQPVQDLTTMKAYVTSQNHGYVVDDSTLGSEWLPWFVNLNDNTNEGVRHRQKPFFSVQFHPEASPGPQDTAFLFDDYMQLLSKLKKTQRKSQWIQNLPERSFL